MVGTTRRRPLKAALLLGLLALPCLIGTAVRALEVYSGREFPPSSAIKATYEAYDPSRRAFDIILGKVRLAEAPDTYQLYYQWKSGEEVRQDNDVKIVMLDTTLWVMFIGTQRFVVVVK